MTNESQQLALLKLLEHNPNFSQRDLASALGVSLGKANYCLKALMQSGFVKLERFPAQKRKAVLAYLLTPAGVEQKISLLRTALRRKESEIAVLQGEIEALRRDLVDVRFANVASKSDIHSTASAVTSPERTVVSTIVREQT